MKSIVGGLTTGLLLGTVVLAQQVITPGNNLFCWTQAGNSLAEVNAFEAVTKLDSAVAKVTLHTCIGTASPFECRIPLLQLGSNAEAAGTHTIELTINRVVGTDRIPTTVSNYNYTIAAAPSNPTNLRIVKGVN